MYSVIGRKQCRQARVSLSGTISTHDCLYYSRGSHVIRDVRSHHRLCRGHKVRISRGEYLWALGNLRCGTSQPSHVVSLNMVSWSDLMISGCLAYLACRAQTHSRTARVKRMYIYAKHNSLPQQQLACVLPRFFYLASIPLLVAAVVYGLRYMPSRRSSWAVKLDVGLAWFSALSVLVLVPTDVASTLQVSSCRSSVKVKVSLSFPCKPCVFVIQLQFVHTSTAA